MGGSFWLSMSSCFLTDINIEAVRWGTARLKRGLFSKSTVLDIMLIREYVFSYEYFSAWTNNDHRSVRVTWGVLVAFGKWITLACY